MLLLTAHRPRRARTSTDVLPGIVVFGLGLSLTVAPLTATALGAVDDEHAGVASGVNNAVARTGSSWPSPPIPVVAGFAPGDAVATDDLLDGFAHRDAGRRGDRRRRRRRRRGSTVRRAARRGRRAVARGTARPGGPPRRRSVPDAA